MPISNPVLLLFCFFLRFVVVLFCVCCFLFVCVSLFSTKIRILLSLSVICVQLDTCAFFLQVPRYKPFSMLTTTEHEIYHAHKC